MGALDVVRVEVAGEHVRIDKNHGWRVSLRSLPRHYWSQGGFSHGLQTWASGHTSDTLRLLQPDK
jgi:hypothetical protein